MDKIKEIKVVVVIFAMLTFMFLIVHIVNINQINNTPNIVHGNNIDFSTYMDIDNRKDATSSWKKRDYNLYGQSVTLTGMTVDEVLYNNDERDISEWYLKINIQNDCFIAQAWNGNVEIHQFVGTDKEKVQTLSLQNYKLDNIQLEYLYDGDLLIPLQAGDYVLYLPSEKFNERNLKGHEVLSVGMIFYYLDSIDLSDYDLTYYYHVNFNQGETFWGLLAIFVLFFTSLIAYIAYSVAARERIRLQKSSLSCMSDIYSIIYMVHINDDRLMEIVTDKKLSNMTELRHGGAKKRLTKLFLLDAEDSYKSIIQEFADLKTLKKRMKESNSIVCEYISKSYGWCSVRFFVMTRDVKNSPEIILFTLQKIGDEKKSMEAIRNRVAQAEAENKAKSVFLANISHEIRTPINAVLGFNDMILRYSKDKKVRSYARHIKSSSAMLLSLINGILDFSKLEAEKMALSEVEYSLTQVVKDAYCLAKARILSKNLNFKFEIDETLPDRLWGDDLRLKQILINLLTNAAKYTDEGEIILAISGCRCEGNVCLRIAVKDTGIGIKEEDIDKLTQYFTRVDEMRNRSVEGTGIGLSLVCGLLELMNSSLQVESVYGEGSVFYFDIEQKVIDPAPIGKFYVTAIEDDDDTYVDNSIKVENTDILVVDDNNINLTVFKELLDGTGANIVTANSGEEALVETAKRAFDIIFTDHMMPEMDGIECFHRIKQQENGLNRNTPVIMLTANAMQGVEEEFLSEGFTGFLSKPIKLGRLEELIVANIPASKVLDRCLKHTDNNNDDKIVLPQINGVENDYSIANVGSAEGVLKILNQFISLYKSDAENLEYHYEKLKMDANDETALADYRIKVHAMKTSAKLFGALYLAGMAYSLEKAANDKKVMQIIDTSPYFLDSWLELGDEIKARLNPRKSKDKKEQIGEIPELLHQLKTSMEIYDIKSADSLVAEIEKYRFPEAKIKLIEELKIAVSNLDAEGSQKICDEILHD